MWKLQLVPGSYAVCRLDPGHGIPHWCVPSHPLLAVTRTDAELSIVCEGSLVPAEVRAERGFGVLRVTGAIDFAVTGLMSALTEPLAADGISLFALSTFDTDYLLFREEQRERVVEVLTRSRFTFA